MVSPTHLIIGSKKRLVYFPILGSIVYGKGNVKMKRIIKTLIIF
jgi:hypothetical protein